MSNQNAATLEQTETEYVAAVAARMAERTRVQFAILELLREAPRNDSELVPAYCNLRLQNEWPHVTLAEIVLQRKALADGGRIVDSGERRNDIHGRPATVWEEAHS